MNERIRIPGRVVGRKVRLALLVVLGLVAAAVVVRLFLGVVTYPLGTALPDVAGIVASKDTNEFDAPEVHLLLADGRELTLHRGDRILMGAVGAGDLIIFGSQPQRWYLTGSPSIRADRTECYAVAADRAYSQPGEVLLVWDDWIGVGVRLPKTTGYDDRGELYDELGHLRYVPFESFSGVSFCLDAAGRVTQYTH
ncbi:MAG TPA: hypothetical protein VK194_00535 [Candidatus Deferrimicrobium sp.]|nr:hypothetical protein [Candidatus Deferrimicrobium sp.]